MALLTRGDLVNSYSWTAIPGDDSKVSGPPDSTLFSRKEGYEVLYMINKLAELWDLKNKASGLKIERMIKNGLPSDTRGQRAVKKWIYDNWEKY